MKRAATPILILLCLLGATPSPATTFDVGPDITTDRRIQQDLERAARHWRSRPCPPASLTVGLMEDDDTVARAFEPRMRGYRCRIWISRSWWVGGLQAERKFLCNVIVHEYGHLLGHTHKDRDPIMRAVSLDGERWVRECRHAR